VSSKTIGEVLASLRSAPWTALFVNRVGEITDLVALQQMPTPEVGMSLGRSHPGEMFKFLQAREYAEDDIRKIIADMVDGYDLSEGPLRPGVTYL